MYRLAFCDLDGTLLKDDHTASPTVRRAMQAVIDAGKWITISSGRSYPQFDEWLKVFPVNAPLVTCNGGVIVEAGSRRVLYAQPMPLDVAREVANFSAEQRVDSLIAFDDVRTVLRYQATDGVFSLVRDRKVVSQVRDPRNVVLLKVSKWFSP